MLKKIIKLLPRQPAVKEFVVDFEQGVWKAVQFVPERHHKGMLLPLGTGHLATCAVIGIAGKILNIFYSIHVNESIPPQVI